jgi:hypothetical protein
VVRHRRQLVAEPKVLRQRLHDQLNRLCPGLSAPQGHGRTLELLRPSGRAVLACAVAFAGRAPTPPSLLARAPGRPTRSNAVHWAERWRACLAPPADASLRAQRLALDLERLDALLRALANADEQQAALLAQTPGQAGADHAPRRRGRTRRRLRRALAPDRALPDRGAAVLGNRARAREPRIGQRLTPPRDLAPGPARTPRRADGDRLGPLAKGARLPRARPRIPGARPRADPDTRRTRTTRLPPLPRPASQPTTPRRAAPSSGPAGAGGDGEHRPPARRQNPACRPPAPAALNRDNESLPHDSA